VLAALLTDSRAFFVVGALIGGFGQGLAYLGGQSLVEKVAPADQRGEVFSLYMIVLYVSGSTAAITFGLIAKWIGLEHASLLYAGFVITITTCTLVVALRSGLLPSVRERPHPSEPSPAPTSNM
jgi:MFS family permease